MPQDTQSQTQHCGIILCLFVLFEKLACNIHCQMQGLGWQRPRCQKESAPLIGVRYLLENQTSSKSLSQHIQSTRVWTLCKVKDAIEVLLVNCLASSQLKYPPSYNNDDHIEQINKLPLVSDFVKPKLWKSTSSKSILPRVWGIPCIPRHCDAD